MTALGTVTTQLIRTCDFALTSVPSDVNDILVALDCNTVSQVAPDAVDSGWYLDWSQDPPHVVLTGAYCTRIQVGVSIALRTYFTIAIGRRNTASSASQCRPTKTRTF